MAKKRGKAKTFRPNVSNQSNDSPTQPIDNGSATEDIFTLPPLMVSAKICRLCEAKDGPFLNIFGGETDTAKKIEELMPFTVAENDELPHKICFRCSAKIEELYEFVHKCIKTQKNCYDSIGKKFSLSTKVKTHRSIWEEQLIRSNITNDDICDAVIKKAMKGIKEITFLAKASENACTSEKKMPSSDLPSKQSNDTAKSDSDKNKKKQDALINSSHDMPTNIINVPNSEEIMAVLEKVEKKVTRSSLRSRNSDTVLNKNLESTPKSKRVANRENPGTSSEIGPNGNSQIETITSDISETDETNANEEQQTQEIGPKPFNIMDHVTMVKVHGVGVLYQCQICNRNFLKDAVVLSHFCAKNGSAREDFTRKAPPPEVPKAPTTVKYINTRTDGNSNSLPSNRSSAAEADDDVIEVMEDEVKESREDKSDESQQKPKKSKPRIGPASKTKKVANESTSAHDSLLGARVATREETPPPPAPPSRPKKNVSAAQPSTSAAASTVTTPTLNCRYKLVSGPNNVMSLVEIPPNNATNETKAKKDKVVSGKKRKPSTEAPICPEPVPKQQRATRTNVSTDNATLEHTESTSQPYPVGLFHTVNPQSAKDRQPAKPSLVPFTTTPQKKQSYSVFQTANPSKLLISATAPKPEPVDEATPAKESDFFTFVNLDPLLEPSYVLPTENIQEQQALKAKKKRK